MKPLIYLASPYSSDRPGVMQDRHEQVAEYAAELITNGNMVFSPICHSVRIAECIYARSDKEAAAIGEFAYWQQLDFAMLQRCDILMVLRLDGWRESVGVKAEIEFARGRDIPAVYVSTTVGTDVSNAEISETTDTCGTCESFIPNLRGDSPTSRHCERTDRDSDDAERLCNKWQERTK